MKRLFRIGTLLCIMLLIAAMSFSVYAGTAAAVSCADEASAGDTVTVTVSISGGSALKGIAVIPSYDSDVFELTGGSWLIKGALADFSVSNGDGVIAFETSTDVDGDILTFALKVKNSAAVGKASVGCSVTVQDSNSVNTSYSASTKVNIVCKHSFTKKDASAGNMKSAATCTSKAVYYYTCEYCGAKGSDTFEYGETTDHTYTKKNISKDYLVSAADCTKKAVYYYSCEHCGAKGTETFEAGEKAAHTYVNTVTAANLKTAADCENPAVYYKSCKNCGEKSTETFESGKALGHTGGKATCTAKAVCDRCKKPYGEMLAHTYDQNKADSTFLKEAKTCTHGSIYYKSCVCGAKGTQTFEADDKLPHTYDKKNTDGTYLKSKATCTAKAVYYYSCTCGAKGTETFESGEVLGHNYRTEWSKDGKGHWHECTRCADKKDNAEHTPGDAATETNPQVCTVCGYVIAPAKGHKHSYSSEWTGNPKYHWHKCTGCDDRSDEAEHVYDNDCDEDCNICGYERETEHKYGDWKTNETKHWHECTVCGNKSVEGRHTPGAEATETTPQTCTVCGYVIKKALGHEHSFTADWKSDETSHWHACSCGEKKDVSAHTPGEWIIDREAGIGTEGEKHRECTVCKATVEKATIPAVSGETTTESKTTSTTVTTSTTSTTQTTGTSATTSATQSTSTTETTDSAKQSDDEGFFSGTQKIVIIIVAAAAVAGICVAVIVTVKKKKH